MPKHLEHIKKQIERSYEKKGIPHKEAERIGYATAIKMLKNK